MRTTPLLIIILLSLGNSLRLGADDGYRLWLRYDEINDRVLREEYAAKLPQLYQDGSSLVLNSAGDELHLGLSGLLGRKIPRVNTVPDKGVVVGVIDQSRLLDTVIPDALKDDVRSEGFLLFYDGKRAYVAGKDERGVLYGVFALLRHLQQGLPLEQLQITDSPKVKVRILNHWDNLDGTVERGYAGFSIWNWHQLPDYLDPRYTDYARANASIGINGAVVTNVNAKAIIFRPDYLKKAAALADVFRPYGIKLYLTARFSAPIELGGLPTADPANAQVQAWWAKKAADIYALIPDFGGFVVKANSEGQPGPREYNRSHAEGANMLADALAPYGGIVMWRAFVYSNEEPVDRAKQAYNEFVPLDGKFRKNVVVQVKNGPIDFQPREPIHPLFGAMPGTALALEFQITKEYLGQGTHLVGLGKLFEEVLQTDTYAGNRRGTTVVKIINGELYQDDRLTAMAGVANIGTARNWTGNLFGQADWYAFGRMAWNPELRADDIFREWAGLTFPENKRVQQTAIQLLAGSHAACVSYMTPLGLHHIMGPDHHYGPGPWVQDMPRADWTSVYYHKADSTGIGFDRTITGSDALAQYSPEFAQQFNNPSTCPPEYLLWFHHLPWDHHLPSGNTVWEQLCREYHAGAVKVGEMKASWTAIEGLTDKERYAQVLMHLNIQEKEAKWWRDACLSYFQSFAKMPFPSDLPPPQHNLEYYQSLTFPYAPGIRAKW